MPGRILVIRGGAIGDFILTLPALHLLRDAFPTCELHLLGYKHIVSLAEKRFYADHTRSIEYAGLAGFFCRGGKLDEELSDYFAGFQQVISYLFDPDQIFADNLKRAGVKNLLLCSPKIQDHLPASSQLMQPLEQLALFPETNIPRFYPAPEDLAAAEALIQPDGTPYAVLHPGSGGNEKIWPVENWLEMAARFRAMHPGVKLIVTGGESDGPALASLRQSGLTGLHFLESLTLPVLGAALSRAAVYFGHDTGISHLAAAAGAPCFLLFGPTDPAIWAPPGPQVEVITSPNKRLADLPPVTVWERLRPWLKQHL